LARDPEAACQQPAGDTPGVAAAPVALAGAIVPGVDKFIVTLSAQADVFGVGITLIDGLLLIDGSLLVDGSLLIDGSMLVSAN
jgi:hypothetical protein